jgi:ParB-like nuclease domain
VARRRDGGTMCGMPMLRIAEVLAGSGPDWIAYLDRERVEGYVRNFEAQPPVVVFDTEDGLLLTDGYHRVAAAQQRGKETIDVEVHHGSREDALRYAAELGAAERGIPLQDALAYIKRRSGRWSEED